MSPGMIWMVQTAGWIPASRAVKVVVPSAFGVSTPEVRSNAATIVSLSSQAIRASGMGLESAASAAAVNRRVARSGTWTAPALCCGDTTSASGSWYTTTEARRSWENPVGDDLCLARGTAANDSGWAHGNDSSNRSSASAPTVDLAVPLRRHDHPNGVPLAGGQRDPALGENKVRLGDLHRERGHQPATGRYLDHGASRPQTGDEPGGIHRCDVGLEPTSRLPVPLTLGCRLPATPEG